MFSVWVTTSLEVEFLDDMILFTNPHYRPSQCASEQADRRKQDGGSKVFYLLDLHFWRWLVRSNHAAEKAHQAGKMSPDQGIEFTRIQSMINDLRNYLINQAGAERVAEAERLAMTWEKIKLPKLEYSADDLDTVFQFTESESEPEAEDMPAPGAPPSISQRFTSIPSSRVKTKPKSKSSHKSSGRSMF